jgi:hypothetical protein
MQKEFSMAAPASSPSIFDWAAAKAATQAEYSAATDRLAAADRELHEARASNAPRWRLERARQAVKTAEAECASYRKALGRH